MRGVRLKGSAVGEAYPPGIATYLYLPQERLTFVRVRKCAGSSLWHACLSRGAVQVEQPKGTTLGMWRNPIERMESTYRFWNARGAHRANKLAFEEWVKWALTFDFPHDPHIAPQVDSGNLTGIRIPWDFEAFSRLIGVEEIPVKNDSKPMDCKWTDEMLQEFGKRYEWDLAIWSSLG